MMFYVLKMFNEITIQTLAHYMVAMVMSYVPFP